MSEAVQLALIQNLPQMLTALGMVLSTIAGVWSVIRSGKANRAATAAHAEAVATKAEVNGGLAKMLKALEAGHRAETKGARAEALAEAALQTATATPATSVVVPLVPRPARSTDPKPDNGEKS